MPRCISPGMNTLTPEKSLSSIIRWYDIRSQLQQCSGDDQSVDERQPFGRQTHLRLWTSNLSIQSSIGQKSLLAGEYKLSVGFRNFECECLKVLFCSFRTTPRFDPMQTVTGYGYIDERRLDRFQSVYYEQKMQTKDTAPRLYHSFCVLLTLVNLIRRFNNEM